MERIGRPVALAGLVSTVLKQNAFLAVDPSCHGTMQHRFLFTDHGVAHRSETTPWSDSLTPASAPPDPAEGDPAPEIAGDDTLEAVPSFFSAIFWSLLLFVAAPAIVIFGIYWLIWR